MSLTMLQNFLLLHPALSAVCAGAIGACVGSFINVCIYRIPQGISIVTPASRCACGKPIPFWFNIPLFGWLMLRGRADCCGAKISLRYPLIELITALFYAAAWLLLPPAKASVACVLLPLLILLAGCDLDDMMVPDAPNFALVGTGLFFSILLPSIHGETSHNIEVINRIHAATDSLIGIAVGTALVWWIRTIGTVLAGREAMGEADIILCAGIGAYCGWQGAAFCLFGGSVIGVITALPGMILSKIKGEEYTGVVPFVPSLATAGTIWFFRGPELVMAWHQWVNS
jgi:leader peptidase (prepilin peptidase)/N-methyltransferase